jgi:hypothetical protein
MQWSVRHDILPCLRKLRRPVSPFYTKAISLCIMYAYQVASVSASSINAVSVFIPNRQLSFACVWIHGRVRIENISAD